MGLLGDQGREMAEHLFFFCPAPAPRTLVMASSPEVWYLFARYFTPGRSVFRALAAGEVFPASNANGKLTGREASFLGSVSAISAGRGVSISGPSRRPRRIHQDRETLLVPQRNDAVRRSWVPVFPWRSSASASREPGDMSSTGHCAGETVPYLRRLDTTSKSRF